MGGKIPGLRTSSPSLPATPNAANTKSARFEIEDEDLDELAHSIPDSSPYFTQPTQIVNRTTQPTQIINRTTQPTQIVEKRTTLQRSSPPIPDTPRTVIEVPASSPFQTQSAQKRQAPNPPKAGPAPGRLASAMAPAGTVFRAPAAAPRRPQPAVKRQFLSNIASDDDLANDYKRSDSSDDDQKPMRGEIKPSSFVKTSDNKDIDPNEIRDIRLRYLTRQVHKCVVKSNSKITYRQCRDALQDNGLQMAPAVESLLDETRTKPAASTASFGSRSKTIANQSQSKSWTQTKLTGPSKSRAGSSSPPPSPEPAKNVAPRRRLVKGRRNRSASPDKVFSVSSSHVTSSAATSPGRSSPDKPGRMAARASASGDSQSQHAKNQRQRAAASEVITIDSGSESDDDLPSLSNLGSKKRKLVSASEKTPQAKKRGRLVSRKEKSMSEPKVAKTTPVAKAAPKVIELSDGMETDESEPFPTDIDTDSDASGVSEIRGPRKEHSKVLEYLNTCTPEALARMTGSTVKDSQLITSKRLFESFDEVEKIKTKGSKAKSKQGNIGEIIIDKLDTWFKAFDAVTTVINKCIERGDLIKNIMDKWDMDTNGKPKSDSTRTYKALPIAERPALMDENVQLKSYQLFGLNWMSLLHKLGYSAILADDMGLGKTCQVISLISHLIDTQPDARPHLIMVPPSTLENWANEFERFAPSISLHIYSGNNRRDIDPLDIAEEYDVVLTSYSMVERKADDLHWLSELKPQVAVFDEGHKLKNPNTILYHHLSRLPSKWRLVLTGTPVQNNLKELLGLLSFVEPSLFESGVLQKMHTIFEAKVPNKDILNFAALAKERVSNARTIMKPFILQRRKDEVIGLPKRTDHVELIPLAGSQKVLYEGIKDSFLAGKTKARGNKDKGNLWQQLRKAAIHPQLFRRHFTDEMIIELTDLLWKAPIMLPVQSKEPRFKTKWREELMAESDFSLHLLCKDYPKYLSRFDVAHKSWEEAPKVKKLLELIRSYQANGDRCLVFSRYEMVIDILRETLHYAEIPYCELTGRSGVAERFPEIERFNENSNIPVFLLTTGAGGTGLNLTAANKIILFDQSDNPQEDVQASNRAHRIGQTREVEVIRLITEKTIETMIFNSCIKKLTLAASVEGVVEDEESLEEECRKKMLLGEEEEVEVPPSQAIALSQA
ncbi:hypothetical protein PFICI_00031 [Pestalotiopsis fici W106-1]|uniref:ATP-dependent helicase fft2 n=1 Tax=Pestalotiopsis fici (strain W106-1 / CGMCC3.15140) TaxID=1229662 RepID=W3XJH7_PESFW|nr:uncharacterized protein PFICI_00031 [Pestalotiopsis fici W106-1]ETS86203.1 hypothetical protein PFICI_00031 [Pestalotiopsis fici W106-1]